MFRHGVGYKPLGIMFKFINKLFEGFKSSKNNHQGYNYPVGADSMPTVTDVHEDGQDKRISRISARYYKIIRRQPDHHAVGFPR